MDSSSTVKSRVSGRRRALKSALAGSSRRAETVAAELARGPGASVPTALEEPEPVPDLPAAEEDPEVEDSGRRGLKRKSMKSGEGAQHPIAKKARTVDSSDNEESDYPHHRWPDSDWERPGRGRKVMYELNFPRVRLFVDCTDNNDDEHCRPINHRPPTNAEVEQLVEEVRVAIKRWVYFPPSK